MSADALLILRSIDATLKEMLALAKQRKAGAARAAAPAAGPTIASDRDLDSKYGDPLVRFDPRDWTGPSCKGLVFSSCPPEFLEMLAETFEHFAEQDEREGKLYNGKPTAPYKRKDAARARGWAARMRSGKHTPPAAAEPGAVPAGWQDAEDPEL